MKTTLKIMYMKFLVHKMGFMMQEELTGAAHFQLHKTLKIRQNITINELTKLMFILKNKKS